MTNHKPFPTVMPPQPVGLCPRDRLVRGLLERRVPCQNIQRLRLRDVVLESDAGYLEARDRLVGSTGTVLCEVDPFLREMIEDYLNAAHQGRPFLDYRPDIGPFLFPSPLTGDGLSRRTLRKVGQVATGPDPEPEASGT